MRSLALFGAVGAAAFSFAPPSPTVPTLTVAVDGTGQFRTVQAAIDSLAPETGPTIIRIRPGVYKERISIGPTHPHLTLRGDGRGAAEKTVLTFDLSARSLGADGKPVGTSGSASFVLTADDFTAEDLTFENSAGPGSKVGQAVAVRVAGDRCVFRRCRFLGWQDTLYANASRVPGTVTPLSDAAPKTTTAAAPPPPNSSAMPGADRLCRQYYQDCFIAGSTDFIFGSARAMFDRCELRTRAAGPITAHARTTATQPGGYVFRDCRLTAEPGVADGSTILGRPWRPYARVVFLSCTLGPHIAARGWENWNDPEREKTAFYAEADCTGPGANRAKRVAWSRALTAAEAAEFAPARFLAGPDRWNPGF